MGSGIGYWIWAVLASALFAAPARAFMMMPFMGGMGSGHGAHEAPASTAPALSPLKISGFLKAEYRMDSSSAPAAPASKGGNEAAYFPDANGDGLVDGGVNSTVWIRRARLVLAGDLSPRLSYAVLLNGHLAQNILGSAEIRLKPSDRLVVTLGQFKLPLGIESVESSHLNPTMDRAEVTERLTQSPAYRDLGGMVTVTAGRPEGRPLRAARPESVPGSSYGVRAFLAVVNGNGHNRPDDNDRKDVVGRLAIPLGGGLEAGGSGYLGWAGPAGDPRTRLGGDLQWRWTSPELGALLVRTEYLRQVDEPVAETMRRQGAYLLAAYRRGMMEPLARIDWFDPDEGRGGDRFLGFTMGANMYLIGASRLSLNHTMRSDQARPWLGGLTAVQAQVAF